MKFSVLLPTRNRLDFLKYAVDSVLRQNEPNIEIIISDNASSENIGEYVKKLNDPAIKYSRTEKFLTVTENWNRCLEYCSGDYVIMLGDDDILLKNYFKIIKKLIENWQPDLIYTNAFLYAYPNVLPGYPEGVFNTFGSLHAMPKKETPFLLDFSARLNILQRMLSFETAYGTNMQHALFHRSLINKIKRKEKFFYSPYPDFYAMNALFLNAEKALIYPKELVVIGITPKSHGYYFYNNKEKEGVSFLQIEKELEAIPSLKTILLPAPGSMLSFWLGAMELFKNHFSIEKYNLKLDYTLYRENQVKWVLGNYLAGKKEFKHSLQEIMKLLSFSEKISFVWPFLLYGKLKNLVPKEIKKLCKSFLQRRKTSLKEIKVGSPSNEKQKNKFKNALEIFEEIEPVNL